MLQQEKCSKLTVHNRKVQATTTDNHHKTRDRALHLILSPSTAVGFVFCTCFYATLTVLRHFTHQLRYQLLCRCSRLSSLCCGVSRFPSSAWQCTSPVWRRMSALFRDVVFIACIRDFLCHTPKQGKLAYYLLPQSSKFRSRFRCQTF